MRWPFRRKDARPEPTVPSTAGPAAAPRRAPESPVRRPGRQWSSLPPLAVTVAPSAPLVIGPAPVLAPLPGNRLVFGPPVTPVAGRVAGLARPVPREPEPTEPVAATPPVAEPPALPHRPARPVPSTPAAPLTEAVPRYVGEPREPATPHRAPGWLRYAPAWLTQGEPDPLGLPMSAPEPSRPEPAPRPVFPPTRLSEGPAPEPAAEPTPGPTSEPGTTVARAAEVTPAMPAMPPPKRRPSLGESRKLGLGAPIRKAPEQALVLPQEPPAPPEPPRLEPAAEPAPRPVARAVERPAAEEEPDDEPPRPQPPPQPPPPPPQQPPAEAAAAPVRPVPAAVPLVYKGAEGRRERPAARPGVTQVPAGLADAIHGRTGVDVSDVPVHRTAEASAQARSLGARAFTRGAEVYLPEEAGPLDAPKARGLLAHELVHVVQQRTLGPSLPAPSTPGGAALEEAAVAAEHEHGGGPVPAPAPLVHPSLTQVIGQAARTAGVQLAPLVAEPTVSSVTPVEVTSAMPPAPLPSPSLSDPVRADIGSISEASANRVIEEWTNPLAGGTGFATGGAGTPVPSPAAEGAAEAEMTNQVLQVINLDRAGNGEQPLSTLDDTTMAQIRQTIAEQTAQSRNHTMLMATALATSSEPAISGPAPATPQAQEASAQQRQPEPEPLPVPAPSPVPDPAREEDSALRDGQIDLEKIDLDDLSTRLYDRLRSRLRLELLIDRERAGLLTDFR